MKRVENRRTSRYGKYYNRISQAPIQAARLENYSDEIFDIIENYAEEIESAIMAYNRKSCEETMMIRGTRKTSEDTQNRKTHMDNVTGIAVEIAKKLGLHKGITRIMAANHDIGHTFFGHGGEWWLSNIKEKYGMGYYCHNALGPAELIYRHRIYDEIIQRIQEFQPEIKEQELKRIRKSLWLIFDGINSHNGEKTEAEFIPNKEKTEEKFLEELEACFTTKDFDKTIMPATIEGCLIRLCDKISYIPYDMLDGLKEGMIDKIDGEYIPIFTSLGISEEEINRCNERKQYEKIARKLQIIFTKDVILNSSKQAIKMSPEISYAMHELRNINNCRIVQYSVLKEDNEIYPVALEKLMNEFAKILINENAVEGLEHAIDDDEFVKPLMKKYQDTAYEGLIKYISETTPEDYEFTINVLEEAANQNSIPMEKKIALEYSAKYLATLNDIEIFNLFKETGSINEEQAKSLTRTYKQIGIDGLKKEQHMHEQFKEITKAQVEETKKTKEDYSL